PARRRRVPFGRERPPAGEREGARVTDPIRILLAEDPGMVRGALAAVRGMEPDMEVIHRLSSGDDVVQAATALRPHVALLDIEMPGTDGLTAAAGIPPRVPACQI